MTQALRRGILEVPNSAEAHAALAQLSVRVSRIESARLAENPAVLDEMSRSLFINYGAAILSDPTEISSHSDTFDLETSDGSLSDGEVNLQLRNFCEWLRCLKIVPRRIFTLEDFDSQIIGRVLAHHLDIETSVSNGDGFTHSKSLIVSADNRVLVAAPLRTVFPAQVLYSFNLHREGGGIVPDVAGVSMPRLVLPWHQERLSPRKIANVVERVTSADMNSAPVSLPARLEFYRARRQLLTAGNSTYIRASLLTGVLL